MSLLGRLFGSESTRWVELRGKLLAARWRSDRNVSQLGSPTRSADPQPEDALFEGARAFRTLRKQGVGFADAVRCLALQIGSVALPTPLSVDRLLWLHLAHRFPEGPHLSTHFFDMAMQNIAYLLGDRKSVV